MKQQPKHKQKDNFWQVVRGICILAVIMIHCPNGLDYADQSFDYYSWVLIRQFINFPVAVFIFLSGYFTNVQKIRSSYKDYLISRGLIRLFVPFLVWSIVYTIYNHVINVLKGEPISVGQSLVRIAIGKAATPFYYILVLIQLLVLTPLLLKLINRKLSFIAYCITIIYLVFLYLYVIKKGQLPPLYATVFFPWTAFYVFGIRCRLKEESKITSSGIMWYILPVLMIILELLEVFLLQNMMNQKDLKIPADFVCSQLRVSSFLYAAALILLFLAKHSSKSDKTGYNLPDHKTNGQTLESCSPCGKKYSWFSYIGDRSYGLFYIHYLIISLLKVLLSRTPAAAHFLPYFLIVFVLALIISLIIIELFRKAASAAGKEEWLKYIGFD